MAEKLYYTMGEVAEMLCVSPTLLRFWEKRFDIIKPHKNKKGNRLFSPDDVRNLKTIYHLVKERGMTLAGAEKQLRAGRGGVERDMEITERLGAIRALLVEVRNELAGGGVLVDDGVLEEEVVVASASTDDITTPALRATPPQEGNPPAVATPKEGVVVVCSSADDITTPALRATPPQEGNPAAATSEEGVVVVSTSADDITTPALRATPPQEGNPPAATSEEGNPAAGVGLGYVEQTLF